ncbi:MAG: cysteine synthase family protein [Candidatus Moranbacteria bacterium]|nr:cysteine synthase family protein [bacterium]MDP1833937.1 cysteine synthase family protein [Candidatus Moranbacteria bacterium]MDZ4384895.1 cysteine synthase family protein [Candidatus Moranbacteria bacterium]
MLHQNILSLIGDTPVIKVSKINPNPKVNLYIKLEGQNPSGSIKDRIALAMIKSGEKSGELTRDKIILEPTSGNTGIGLAMVAALKGYRVVLTMSAGMSEERRRILKAYGAEIVLTLEEQGTDGAIMEAHRMVAGSPGKYWMPNQFANPENPEIHYRVTAEEILADVPDITHFVAGLGTSGTLMGISRKLKEKNKAIRVIAVEPALGHKLQGLKNMQEAIMPEIYDPEMFDEKINVSDEDACSAIRKIAREEGIFLGMSSGAALHAALELAKTLEAGDIVIISPDRGEKYASTNLFN